MRFVKCICGKGLFANPTGGVEFQSAWGCVPIVVAATRPAPDCLGLFFGNYPRIISVPRYRFVRASVGDDRFTVKVDQSKMRGIVSGWTA